ncbi:MAG: cation:proton antiporter [Gemmataceae bacterium]|nr:cation:proton antiporter [Gemmata sp.]MDW8198839.1 cation:proton antiporter [Gemmataceae bacterium]
MWDLLADVPDVARAFTQLPVEDLLLPVLLQLIVIIAAARLFGALARYWGQPSVVGEIAAGLILGPSLLGWLAPEVFQALFHPSLPGLGPALADGLIAKIFTVIAQLGLILLLFLVGLEFEFHHLRGHARSAMLISLAGIAVPFTLGVALAPFIHPHLEAHPRVGPVSPLGLALFLGVTLGITAIPVLARIMMELNITRTRLGTITMTAAAIDDACGWIILASVIAIVQSNFDPWETLRMVGLTVSFALAMAWIVRPGLIRFFRYSQRVNRGHFSNTAMAVLLVSVLLAAVATNLIGIFAVFGAFTLGVVLSDQHELQRAAHAKLYDVVTAFFLPVFFTYTGLRTDITALPQGSGWLLCGILVAAAVVGKLVGCGLAARVSGFTWKESGIIGAMMNARGLMALVAINLGYDLGVVPQSLYCMLVLMALTTTVLTTPLLLWLRYGTELEESIARSGFGSRQPPPSAAFTPEAATADDPSAQAADESLPVQTSSTQYSSQ